MNAYLHSFMLTIHKKKDKFHERTQPIDVSLGILLNNEIQMSVMYY